MPPAPSGDPLERARGIGAESGDAEGQARQLRLLLLCFFLSGLAALIYQTAWMREFSLVFGTSELAVATVLASYMAGLAGGAAVAARLAARVRNPVRLYGLLELGIAISALAVPAAIRAAQTLHVALLGVEGALPGSGGAASALFYLGSAFLILLVPTGLMGATLPLLARHAVRRESEIGARIGVLYATNTVGAVGGTLLAGFVLLPALGLQRTVWVAVATNAAVFAVAVLLARGAAPLPAAVPGPAGAQAERGRAWILPLILISGAVSFTYEVLWTRLLGHLFGGSVYAFATMLATFLSGIAIGSWLASRRASRPGVAAGGFALAQLGAALFSLLAFVLLDRAPELARAIGSAGDMRLLAEACVAALVLLPGTIFIGATFPFAVRVLATSEHDAGPASARVYAWNTVGAIAGAIGAGFFLIPALGFAGMIATAVATNLLLAFAASLLLPWPHPHLAGAAALGCLALALLRPEPPWQLLQTSSFDLMSRPGPIVFHAVGRSATVMVQEELGSWRISTNGLPEAAILPPGGRGSEYRVAQWLGSLYGLARPEARSVLMIGLGGGVALEWVPGSAVEIDVVELEPEVVRANRSIGDARRLDPLADPRLDTIENDARAALLLGGKRYDAIVSQPSHPWTAGASHLYTRDFFAIVRDHLTPEGVFVQWMGLNFVDAELFRTLLATLQDVFPHVRVYQPKRAAAIFLASQAPLDAERDAARAIEREPLHFAQIGVHRAEDLAAALVLDEQGVRRLAEGAQISTDDRNLLQMRSPAITRRRGRPLDIQALTADHDPLDRADLELDRAYLVRRMISYGMPERARRFAAQARSPAERATALGLLDSAQQRNEQAARRLARALALDPSSDEARMALLRLRWRAGMEPAGARGELAHGLQDPEAAVVEGWRVERGSEAATLRALDARLAVAVPSDPGYADATRLRAIWRLHAGTPEQAAEARALLDQMLSFAGNLDDLLLRARAAAQLGDTRGAITTLAEVALRFEPGSASPLARRALAVLRSLPASEDTRVSRARLRRMLLQRSSGQPETAAMEGAPS